MKKILTALAFATASLSAHAEAIDSPVWACRMAFQGTAQGLQVVVGRFDVNAKGTIKCVGSARGEVTLPVTITIESNPIDLKLAAGNFKVYGQSGSITLGTHSPEDLLGTYVVGQAQASVIAGAGLITAAHTDFTDLVLSFSLQFTQGFGVNLGLNKMVVALDQSRIKP